MKTKVLGLLLLSLLLSSCASVRRSMVTGAVGGATAGALTGGAFSRKGQKKNVVTGSLIGGLLGTWAGYLVHKRLDKRDERTRKELLFHLKNFGTKDGFGDTHSKKPMITKPIIGSDWVEAQINGNKLIEGHRVWTIEEKSQWVPNTKSKEIQQ